MSAKNLTYYVDSDPELITLNDTEFPDFEIIVSDPTNHTEEDEFADLPDLIPFDDLDDQITIITNDSDDTPAPLPLDALSELIYTVNDLKLVCNVLELLSNKIKKTLHKCQYSNHTGKIIQ